MRDLLTKIYQKQLKRELLGISFSYNYLALNLSHGLYYFHLKFPHTATAPHQIQSDVVKKARAREIEVAKKSYEWRFKSVQGRKSNGMPNHLVAGDNIDKLPLIFGLLTDATAARRRRDKIKFVIANVKEKFEG